jgi:hypothetical protein
MPTKAKTKPLRFAYYCTCGVSMVGTIGGPDGAARAQALWDMQGHVGEGHAPTDAKGAAAARRKQEREESAASVAPC